MKSSKTKASTEQQAKAIFELLKICGCEWFDVRESNIGLSSIYPNSTSVIKSFVVDAKVSKAIMEQYKPTETRQDRFELVHHIWIIKPK